MKYPGTAISNSTIPYSPLITIIVAVLNASETLNRCLQSIVHQTHAQKEIIIMDGGSTDAGVSIIKAYENDIGYWESKPDRGIYHAWNKALARSRGEWICFLGADDYFWNDRVLSDFCPCLLTARSSGIRAVYGRVARVTKDGRILKILGKPWHRISWQMRHGMPIPHPGLMHHKSLFDTHGLFDESFKIAGDYELLLRELRDSPALFCERIQSVCHQHGGIAETDNLRTHREVARARKKNGLPTYTLVWLLVYIRAIIRYYLYTLRKT